MATVVSEYTQLLPAYPPGEIMFIDIPVSNIDRAMTFYRNVFGWQILPEFPPFPGRTEGITSHYLFQKGNVAGCFTVMSDSKDVLQAGVVQGSPKERVAFYLATENMDETLANVEKYGGTVHRKMSLYEGKWGIAAQIIDSEGNFLGVGMPPKV
ncbi:hypothetical protein QBC34DRAFT_497428 [Podospora aff. communis PSN243]|uniref:VOC domain-containing protein n=1 Tax=Podospora aff. communis PSN243 TaxID=3040156 RepID=A0AAV9GCR9_9PEZI|nr:hypothetical protein QBC34DRAFT_497428 [Podospora aff. communis PSN243]